MLSWFDISTLYVLLIFLADARVERLKGTTGKFARSFLHIGLAAENHLDPTPVQISNEPRSPPVIGTRSIGPVLSIPGIILTPFKVRAITPKKVFLEGAIRRCMGIDEHRVMG